MARWRQPEQVGNQAHLRLLEEILVELGANRLLDLRAALLEGLGWRRSGQLHDRKATIDGPAGESWELSGVEGSISEIQNGHLSGMSLKEIIAEDPVSVLGKEAVDRFGSSFPILIKFIDAKTDLSIQVHPDDELATKRHGSKGKTEMWYIMDADPDARLVLGFQHKITPSDYLKNLNDKTLFNILHEQVVRPGEIYFIEAGTVHAIGGGIVLAEIQQTSDITYRIYDYDRVGADGKQRELHTDLALEAMKLEPAGNARISYTREDNQTNSVIQSPYFTTKFLPITSHLDRDLSNRNAFTIYMCVEGTVLLTAGKEAVTLSKGMTALIPAILEHVRIEGEGDLLEITL